MAATTIEKLKERASRLRGKLAESGDKLDQAQVRALKKRIRRAQRRGRALAAAATRAAGKAGAAKAE